MAGMPRLGIRRKAPDAVSLSELDTLRDFAYATHTVFPQAIHQESRNKELLEFPA